MGDFQLRIHVFFQKLGEIVTAVGNRIERELQLLFHLVLEIIHIEA